MERPWTDPAAPPDSDQDVPASPHDDGPEVLPLLSPPVRPESLRKPRWRRTAVEWLTVLALAAAAAVLLRAFVVQAFWIPSGSMEPTLKINDRIIVDKLSYHLHPVHRGDIVVFRRPPADSAGGPQIKDLVKRVVGLPGETISAHGGNVYINGKILKEPYLPRGTHTYGIPKQVIPKGEYFVMGDNRSDSYDSRRFGPIPGSLIIGRVMFRFWPLSRLAWF